MSPGCLKSFAAQKPHAQDHSFVGFNVFTFCPFSQFVRLVMALVLHDSRLSQAYFDNEMVTILHRPFGHLYPCEQGKCR